jgi:hypothetical protein
MSAFDRRLTFVTETGNRPRLAADCGAEHVVVSDAEVSRAVESLGADLDTTDGTEARAAAERHGVFGPPAPIQWGTREAALAHVCREIADIIRPPDRTEDSGTWSWWKKLVRRREWLRSQRSARLRKAEPFIYTVALFGEGGGILVQKTADTWPYWFQEECFMLDEDCAVHRFIAWSR